MKKLTLAALLIFSLLCYIADAQTFSSASVNSSLAGTPIEHRLRWQDTSGLSSYVFSFDNCTGEFSNITSGTLSGNEDWSNVTVAISNSLDCQVRWKVYANNSYNNWSVSSEYSYTTSSLPKITIASPENKIYNIGIVVLEFAIDKSVVWIGYSLDGSPNITISGNSSLIGLKDGVHILILYARDSSNNVGTAVISFTNNIPWKIEPFTLPEGGVTVGENIYVFARITQENEPIEEGYVNYTLNGFSDILYNYYYYYENYWFSDTSKKLDEEKQYLLNVSGYYDYFYKGSATKPICVGNLSVKINSLKYKPGSNFVISTETFSGSSPYPAKASYVIRNSSFYDVLSGNLDCFGNICNKTVNDFSSLDEYGFLISVNASNESTEKCGGSWEYLDEWYPYVQVKTDKTEYKPGETVKIDLISDYALDTANFTIYGLFSTPIAFDRINSTHWTKSYTLGTSIESGSYSIRAYVSIGSDTYNYYDYFYVKASREISIEIDNFYKKPGEIMAIDVISNSLIQDANVSIIRPDGSLETPTPLSTTYITSYKRNKNYTLGLNSADGLYTIKVRANVDGYILEKNATFVVIAWNFVAYSNKYTFYSNETVNITLNIFDVYKSDLNFNVYINLTKPDGIVNEIYRGSSTGSSKHTTSYFVPSDYKNGTSTVSILVNDSYGRSKTSVLNFLTYISSITNNTSQNSNNTLLNNNTSLVEFLSVKPSVFSIVTTVNKIFLKSFELENSANTNTLILSIEIPHPLSNLVFLDSKPEFIFPHATGNLVLKIDTTGLEPNSYFDYVKINSSNGVPQIYISINVIGNVSSEAENYMVQLAALEESMKSVKSVENLENLLSLSENIKKTLNEANGYYQSEDYETAKSKLESAITSFNSLKEQIQSLNLAGKGFDYTSIIWIFAIAAVAAIVGILFIKKYHHKDKVKFIEVYSREQLK
jgi:hypothetical protein